VWGRLVTCAPIANRRKKRGLPTRAQDAILPHNQTDPLPAFRAWRETSSIASGGSLHTLNIAFVQRLSRRLPSNINPLEFNDIPNGGRIATPAISQGISR
jgi:hypothetical protein